MKNIRQWIPWWVRIAAKIVLARLPFPYSFWKRLRLFEHGHMDQPEKALAGFIEHARTAGLLNEDSSIPQLSTNSDFAVLELGPGDALFTAPIGRSLNASKIWLVDAGAFAKIDMQIYTELFNYLRRKGFSLPIKNDPNCITDLLKECRCEYLTDGVYSLASIPMNSVDYCFSNAVLEHVPRQHFTLMINELFRIIKPNGICVHRIDLRDHLGGGLNHLRFSESIWEEKLFTSSGFYTNRIRYKEMLNIFSEAGFTYTLPRVLCWDSLPIKRSSINVVFSQLSDDDLLVSVFDVVLKKRS